MAREYYCNVCGKKMDIFDAHNHISISESLGYGSKYDGEYVEIDFCSSCLDAIIDKMAISPIAKD